MIELNLLVGNGLWGANMGGAYYIMMVNVAIGAVLLVGFSAFYIYDRSRKAPLFMALATLCFLAGGGFELAAPFVPETMRTAFRFSLYVVNFSAGILLGAGIAQHYKLAPMWKWTGIGFLAALVLTYLVLDMPRQSVLRLSLNQLPLILAIGIATIRVALVERKSVLDKLLVSAMFLFTLNMVTRPVVLAFFGSMGSNISENHSTSYAVIVNLSLAIVTMTTATILMLVLVADLVGELARKSRTDSLSRLLNRRGFDDAAHVFVGQLERGAMPAALIICDIDHFKKINDNWGHATGDIVISNMGMVIGKSVRQSDIAGRVGGEEFCIFLWNANLMAATMVAEGVRVSFESTFHAGVPDSVPVSASFGVAQWQSGMSYNQLFEAADVALYHAKKSGRNRVVTADVSDDSSAVPLNKTA